MESDWNNGYQGITGWQLQTGFSNKNLTDLGIQNIYALPPSFKINAHLLAICRKTKGPEGPDCRHLFFADRNQC